jgi:hypothetical protein
LRGLWVRWALPRKRLVAADLAGFSTHPIFVFFAPDAGLVAHFSKVCLIAKTLEALGHRVLIVGCFRSLPRCTVMDSWAQPVIGDDLRQTICEGCARTSLLYASQYGLPVIDLAELADPGAAAVEADAIPDSSLLDFEHEGAPFGKISAGDLSRVFKVSEFRNLDRGTRKVMREYIATSLTSHAAMQRLMQRMKVVGIAYFGDYGTLVGAATAARRAGLQAANLSIPPLHNLDHRRVQLMPHHTETFRRRCIEMWPQWAKLALPADLVAELTGDMVFRLGHTGRTIYSPSIPRDQTILIEALALDPRKRLVVAYTSSEDEMIAVEQYMAAIGNPILRGAQPFGTQLDWLEGLCGFFARRDDAQLVIRIHPREAVSPQTGGETEYLQQIRERFRVIPPSVRIVWAGDPVSSYGLGEMADLALTSWSTIGTEMARLGVPVVAAFSHVEKLPFGTIIDWAATPEGYFQLIESRLRVGGANLQRIMQTNRWFNLYWLGYCVDLRDVVPAPDFSGLPPFKLSCNAGFVERVLVAREDPLEINHAALAAAQSPEFAAAEIEATHAALRRIVRFLFIGVDDPRDYRLLVLPWDRSAIEHPADPPAGWDAVLYTDGSNGVFVADRMWGPRRSPMAARLAAIVSQDRIPSGELDEHHLDAI